MPLEPFEWAPSTSAIVRDNVSMQEVRQFCAWWMKKLEIDEKVLNISARTRPSNLAIWGIGLACVTLISLCAAVGILFVRGLSKRTYNHFITIFVAVGVGSLITSSTLHLLPQGLGLADGKNFDFITVEVFCIFGIYTFFFCDKFIKISLESKKGLGLADGKNFDFITVEVFCIFGIYTFFFCDKFIKISLESKKINDAEALDMTIARASAEAGAISVRSTDALITSNGKILAKNGIGETKNGQLCDDVVGGVNVTKMEDAFDDSVDMSKQAHGICVHDHEITFNEKKDSAIATVAWMIIFGDGLHNFIDGISIGAAFSESLLSGISVALAVLAEEFPHELGDVAILLNAGMNLKQTLFYNLLSTITCFIGFVIGVLLGSIDSFLKCIFGFSGGMFLYIALSCMIFVDFWNAVRKFLIGLVMVEHQDVLSECCYPIVSHDSFFTHSACANLYSLPLFHRW
ncbi:Zinc transporter ZIP14 [Toxocara canis]|uniref:Zinc transporter ZIP14 n=1 Tax=Toxocara canis TaxID=6265 RepID=A0A0B2V4Y6_TOXCA|nr:Zinc transporter ZIP14 [Toxocara canis]